MSPPTILTVLQCKGGVGKTTIATTLAGCGHLAGFRTILLDLEDPRHCGLASKWFELRLPESRLNGLVTHLAMNSWTPNHFRSAAAGYELVVCDAPASLARATRAAAITSEFAVVPMLIGVAEIFALDPVAELMADVNVERAKTGASPLPWACALNRIDRGTKENQQMAEHLATRADLLPAVLGDRMSFRRAVAQGECAITFKPKDASAALEAWALFQAVIMRTSLAGRTLTVPSEVRTAMKKNVRSAA